MIKTEIILDSINSKTNDRLTTWTLTFPRFILSEFNTHRMLSRNAASSRAIPSKKIIEMVMTEPAMPEFWGKNQAGMQAVEELDDIKREPFFLKKNYPEISQYFQPDVGSGPRNFYWLTDKQKAKYVWLEARDVAIAYVENLLKLGLHKQIANRLLEPWFNITVLCSGTEWENFFALRAHKDAQPEFRILAEMMLEEYNKSTPEIKQARTLNFYSSCKDVNGNVHPDDMLTWYSNSDWHIPFGDKMPDGLSKLDQLKIAIARGARLSYLSFDGETNIEKDFGIYNKLLVSEPLHSSPSEHPAFPITESKFVGNFKGWHSFRKLLPNENAKDSRVIKRKVVNGKVI